MNSQAIVEALTDTLDVPYELAVRMVKDSTRSYKGLSVVILSDGNLGIAIGLHSG